MRLLVGSVALVALLVLATGGTVRAQDDLAALKARLGSSNGFSFEASASFCNRCRCCKSGQNVSLPEAAQALPEAQLRELFAVVPKEKLQALTEMYTQRLTSNDPPNLGRLELLQRHQMDVCNRCNCCSKGAFDFNSLTSTKLKSPANREWVALPRDQYNYILGKIVE